MDVDQTHTYNLGAVLHETGLGADTLRAWERRYGVPLPQRTAGGHRVYSRRDIELIRWLMNRQAEGLSISHAVERWRDLAAAGLDPVQPDRAAVAVTPRGGLEALRDQWLEACLRFDEPEAEQILEQAFSQHAAEKVVAAVLEGALRRIGELWASGQATVQQEHFMSELATRRLEALIAAAPAPLRPQVILLACAESELHAWPLLHLNFLLRRLAWKVVFLGASVPAGRLQETATAVQAEVVVLCAARLASAAKLKETASALAQNGTRVLFGGRIFDAVPELRRQIPGLYAGGMHEAVEGIERLVARKPLRTTRQAGAPNAQADAYQRARRSIEIDVQQQMSAMPVPPAVLEVANTHFGEALAAALQFGSASYLEADLGWVRAMTSEHGVPPAVLGAYLTANARALRSAPGGQLAPVADWLEAYARDLH